MTKREFMAEWSKRANKEGRIEVKSHRGHIELVKPDKNDFVRVIADPGKDEARRLFRSSALCVRVDYDRPFERNLISILRTVRSMYKEYYASNNLKWAENLIVDEVEYLWNWMVDNVREMRKQDKLYNLDYGFYNTLDYIYFLEAVSHPRIYKDLIALQDSGVELNLIDETK